MQSHINMAKGSSQSASQQHFRSGIALLTMCVALSGLPAPAKASIVGDAIVHFAEARLGKCVDRNLQTRSGPCPTLPDKQVGDGECTDLVRAALAAEHATPPTFSPNWYTWGLHLGVRQSMMPYQKGDIIQFWNYSTKSPDGRSWWSTSHHTAIIVSSIRWRFINRITVIEQNNNGVRAVTTRT